MTARPLKLSYVFRTPQYPVLCQVEGEVVAARNRQELERRLGRLDLPQDGRLPMVDATGEGWEIHLALGAVSPLVLKKQWTKADVLRLYRESASGQRLGLPDDDGRLLRMRLHDLIAMIAGLVEEARRRK